MLYEYYFQGKRPSKAQVIKQVNEGIKQGASLIHISWGENRIEFFKGLSHSPNTLFGSGWIKTISGHDIAEDLNKKQTNKTLNLWNT